MKPKYYDSVCEMQIKSAIAFKMASLRLKKKKKKPKART